MDLSRPFVVDARGLIHPGCMISSYADVLVPTQLGRRVVRQLTQQPGARAIIEMQKQLLSVAARPGQEAVPGSYGSSIRSPVRVPALPTN